MINPLEMKRRFSDLSGAARVVAGSFIILLLSWQNAAAQDWAKAAAGEIAAARGVGRSQVGRTHDQGVCRLSRAKEKTPVVLVIHEIFGMTDWVKGLCDQLAEAGVIAIAPDLLSGQTYDDVDGARKAISSLPKEQVKADLDAASDYALTKIPAANGTLAVCGFCWGGGWTFSYANENAKLKAAYSFYGTAPDEASKVANIPCPVYGFYAENDARVDATIPKAEELMKAASKKYEPVTYKGAGHGFMRDGESPTGTPENKKARDDAWARWKLLLKQL